MECAEPPLINIKPGYSSVTCKFTAVLDGVKLDHELLQRSRRFFVIGDGVAKVANWSLSSNVEALETTSSATMRGTTRQGSNQLQAQLRFLLR